MRSGQLQAGGNLGVAVAIQGVQEPHQVVMFVIKLPAQVQEGLATVAQASAVVFPDIIRQAAPIPDSKLIALAIAIGYPDWDDPINQSRSKRVPLEEIITWYGW